KLVDNEKFAKRIFSQIKNRIIFHRSGIYSERYASSSVEKKLNKNIIFPSQTSLNNILKKNLSFIINNFWLFEIDTIQRIKEVEETMSHEKFNYDYMNTSNNSTLFHPIDENEYNDLENSDIVRESAMTNAMIEHEKYGLYNKEIYEDYENLVKHYDENINQIKEYIKELIEYHQSYFRIKNIIYKKLVNRNLEYQIDLIENYYENYNNTKEVFVKKDLTSQLLIEIPNLELLKYYLKFDDILVYEIDNIIDKLLAILTDNKYMSDYEKDLFEQYTYMQDELIKMLDCKNVKGLRKNWTVESINSFISYYEKDFDIENIAEVYSHNRNDSQEFNEAENLYGLKYFDCDINSIKINKLTKNDDPFEYEGVIDNSESNDDSEMPF
ncbi:MAG: hypothetical protein U9N59_12215, partial [Campylobacterota bacterium]|nr:hypothetical protein [Campylobacterota bacterium]